jgi:hypothetical protein
MKSEKEVIQEVGKLKVELTVQEWEAVLAVVDNSTSAHIQVKSLSAELVKQLQAQLPTVKEPKALEEDAK